MDSVVSKLLLGPCSVDKETISKLQEKRGVLPEALTPKIEHALSLDHVRSTLQKMDAGTQVGPIEATRARVAATKILRTVDEAQEYRRLFEEKWTVLYKAWAEQSSSVLEFDKLQDFFGTGMAACETGDFKGCRAEWLMKFGEVEGRKLAAYEMIKDTSATVMRVSESLLSVIQGVEELAPIAEEVLTINDCASRANLHTLLIKKRIGVLVVAQVLVAPRKDTFATELKAAYELFSTKFKLEISDLPKHIRGLYDEAVAGSGKVVIAVKKSALETSTADTNSEVSSGKPAAKQEKQKPDESDKKRKLMACAAKLKKVKT